MRIDVVTLFPGMVEPVLGASMLGRARTRGLVDIRVVNLRDYAEGKHRITDDYQFGGGGGMVLKPEPLFAAVHALSTEGARVVLLDPRGRTFTQKVAAELAGATHLILLAGRARASALAHVANTTRALEGCGSDVRRAAARRAIRTRGEAGADRMTRPALAAREGRTSWMPFAWWRRGSSKRTGRRSCRATRCAYTSRSSRARRSARSSSRAS